MDLTAFDARTASNNAQPMHLRNPVDGALMYVDNKKTKACIVMVRGTESRVVQTRLSEIRAERAVSEGAKASKKAKTQEVDTQGLQDLHEKLARDMHPLVTEFKNIERGKDPLDANDPEAVTWFLNLQLINGQMDEDGRDLSFLGQIAEFASERGNYLGNSKSD